MKSRIQLRFLLVLTLLASVMITKPVEATGIPYQFAAYNGDLDIGTKEGLFIHDIGSGKSEEVLPGFGPQVTWTPDGSAFAFRDSLLKLSIYNPDTRTTRKLANVQGQADRPVIAPAGNKVLYSSFAPATGVTMRTVGIDGSNDRPLIATGTSLTYSNQPWSPDGTQIVGSSTALGGPTTIYIVDVASGSTTNFTLPDSGYSVSWSPTSDVLAVRTKSGGITLSSPAGTVIANLPAAVGGVNNADVVWSPDGSRLVGVAGKKVYLWNTQVPGPPQLLFDSATAGVLNTLVSSWSSDGALVAVTQVMDFGPSKMSTVNLATSAVTYQGEYIHAAFRPLGKIVATATSIAGILAATDYQASDADTLRLYRAFLNREPDVGGARYWIETSRSGANPDDLAWGFAQSTEFKTANGELTNSEFLTVMYANMLGRTPDAGGFNYWLGLMNGGLSQSGVVRWIVANEEFINRYPYAPTS